MTDAANQRDYFREACERAVGYLSGEMGYRDKVEIVLLGLQNVLAGAGESPDPWTYVTDDDASLPPVGEWVIVWEVEANRFAERIWAAGRWYSHNALHRILGRQEVSAWMRVQRPNKKETPNAL